MLPKMPASTSSIVQSWDISHTFAIFCSLG